MTLTLHKVASCGDVSDDVDSGHVFTFVWDDVARQRGVTSSSSTSSSFRTVESGEIKYGGHSWTVVVCCTAKVCSLSLVRLIN